MIFSEKDICNNNKEEITKFMSSDNYIKYDYPENLLRDLFPGEPEETYKTTNCSYVLIKILFSYTHSEKVYLRYAKKMGFDQIPFYDIYARHDSHGNDVLGISSNRSKMNYDTNSFECVYPINCINDRLKADIILSIVKTIGQNFKNIILLGDDYTITNLNDMFNEEYQIISEYNRRNKLLKDINTEDILSTIIFVNVSNAVNSKQFKGIIYKFTNPIENKYDYLATRQEEQYRFEFIMALTEDEIDFILKLKEESDTIRKWLFDKIGEDFIFDPNEIIDIDKKIKRRIISVFGSGSRYKLNHIFDMNETDFKTWYGVGSVTADNIISAIRTYGYQLIEKYLGITDYDSYLAYFNKLEQEKSSQEINPSKTVDCKKSII